MSMETQEADVHVCFTRVCFAACLLSLQGCQVVPVAHLFLQHPPPPPHWVKLNSEPLSVSQGSLPPIPCPPPPSLPCTSLPFFYSFISLIYIPAWKSPTFHQFPPECNRWTESDCITLLSLLQFKELIILGRDQFYPFGLLPLFPVFHLSHSLLQSLF